MLTRHSKFDSKVANRYWKWMVCLLVLYMILPDIGVYGGSVSSLSWFAFSWFSPSGLFYPLTSVSLFSGRFFLNIQYALSNLYCTFLTSSCIGGITLLGNASSFEFWQYVLDSLLVVLGTFVSLLLIGLMLFDAKQRSRDRAFVLLALGGVLSLISIYYLYYVLDYVYATIPIREVLIVGFSVLAC